MVRKAPSLQCTTTFLKLSFFWSTVICWALGALSFYATCGWNVGIGAWTGSLGTLGPAPQPSWEELPNFPSSLDTCGGGLWLCAFTTPLLLSSVFIVGNKTGHLCPSHSPFLLASCERDSLVEFHQCAQNSVKEKLGRKVACRQLLL